MLPTLYAIIDRTTLDARGVDRRAFSEELREAGVRLVQYRDKLGAPQEVLRGAQAVAEAFAGVPCRFVLNDRADLAALLGWGVHVGQGDLSVADARRVLGAEVPHSCANDAREWATRAVGVSTHNEQQVFRLAALAQDDNSLPVRTGPDYIAIGPVFRTSTKADAEPVVGLEGVQRARALTKLPLVAIGGITLQNAQSVIEAGADSVALIGGLFVEGRSVGDVVRDFLRVLG